MKNEKERSLQRRDLLMYGAASAGLLGFGGRTASVATTGSSGEPLYPQKIKLALLRNYRTEKASSYDRSGGNADYRRLEPGGTLTLMKAEGPGMIGHIWFTIASSDPEHLKRLVLRMFWDGESEPSVEVPVGDFFGLNLGQYFLYDSALLTVAPVKALNAYFPMPFRKSALVTVTSESEKPVHAYYWNIDYQVLPSLPQNAAYFHAQYRQMAPCPGWKTAEPRNLYGTNNYVFMEAIGRGHLVGVTQGVVLNQNGWWGEGDDMLFVDGSKRPVTNGTGSEDYYNGAWGFDGKAFHYPYNGAPHVVNPFSIGGQWCLYRWHMDAPLAFEKSIRFTIEHGTANNRSDDFYSVTYWYQTEPHAKFPSLPPASERIPKVFAVPDGATPVKATDRKSAGSSYSPWNEEG